MAPNTANPRSSTVNSTTYPWAPITIRTILYVSGIVMLIVRIVLQALWSVLWYTDGADSLLLDIALNVLSVLVLVCIVGATALVYTQRTQNEVSYEAVAGSLTFYALSALALLLFAAIVPNGVEAGRPVNILGVVTSNIVAVGTFTISVALAGFITHLLLARRHARTRLLLYMQGGVTAGVWLCSILADLWSGFTEVGIVLTVAGAVVMLMNIRRLNWLLAISFDKKVRLLWLTACAAFAAFVLALMHGIGPDSHVATSAEVFVHSGAVLPSLINVFGFVFFARLFIAIIGSLPNSGIVDRRSNEVESLAALTRLMTELTTVDDLLTSVTGHAMRVCHAHGAWCELYEEDGLRIVATQLVHPDWVRSLHANPTLHSILTNTRQPLLVDSVADTLPEYGRSVGFHSFIAIPLLNSDVRTGTLVMFSTVEFGFELDDLRLLTAFGDTISVALEQAQLMATALEKERLQKEVDVARTIQASLLPRSAPSSPSFDIDSITIPASDVGGDYYDYVRFSTGSHGAIIADVSGKGVPAALYMATLKGVVLAEMRSATGPADLLRRVNTTLHGSMERHTYITMTCVEFTRDCRTLRFARAGHTPTLLRCGPQISAITPGGVAIGIVPPAIFDAALEEVVIPVKAGDICLLTTDGVTERRDADMTEIGLAPIMTMLETLSPMNAHDVVLNTLQLLTSHAGDEDPHDDITIVALIVRGDNT